MKAVIVGMALIPLGLAGGDANAAPPTSINVPPPPISVPPPPTLPVPAPAPPYDPNALPRPPIPTGNPGNWITESDYPAVALRQKLQGVTTFRLTVGTNGRVAACSILQTSGTNLLDEATCRAVSQRAMFKPALDLNGNAVDGTYTNRIRWIIPAEDSPDALVQLAELTRVVTFIVETDGAVTHCSMLINGVDYTASRNGLCANRKEYAPFHDASGKAVRRKVTMTSTVKITDPDAKPVPHKKRRGR